MKLIFLGTGTSIGVPHIRCKCRVCTSTDPHDKRLRASALLQTENGAPGILIDCGPDFRQQILSVESPDLACAIITHTHYDHLAGVDDLRPYSHAFPNSHFPIYCREDVANDLRNRIPYCFVEKPYPGVPQFDLRLVSPFVDFTVDLGAGYKPIKVTPLPISHGALNIYGYHIGNLAYITDATNIPPETIEAIRDVDTLVVNALRIKPHMAHFSLRQALDAIKQIAPRQAFLTHMSHGIGLHAEVSKILPQGVKFAYDGLTINIPD
ncbi:MAG: MBL fold metallo-hydrolase [Muribaculaceae bacterium]|nr:MBL fold metallo-hydrolase [Muribaculaceae bacterium]